MNPDDFELADDRLVCNQKSEATQLLRRRRPTTTCNHTTATGVNSAKTSAPCSYRVTQSPPGDDVKTANTFDPVTATQMRIYSTECCARFSRFRASAMSTRLPSGRFSKRTPNPMFGWMLTAMPRINAVLRPNVAVNSTCCPSFGGLRESTKHPLTLRSLIRAPRVHEHSIEHDVRGAPRRFCGIVHRIASDATTARQAVRAKTCP